MEFKEIEEAALAALNIASKLKDPELTTAIQSVLDKCVTFREEQNLEAPGVLNEEPKQEDHFGEEQSPEQVQDLEKELGTEGDNNDTGTPYQSREEVPEQARDLWDIMSALKDDPHDDRWED